MLHAKNLTKDVMPIVIERQCEGYLAISPPDCPVRIGVEGGSEIEARERFHASLDKWIAFVREYEQAGDRVEAVT